jgi:hypothetical protein
MVWKFHHIMAHQGLLKQPDKDYNGSLYNVMVKRENGDIMA